MLRLMKMSGAAAMVVAALGFVQPAAAIIISGGPVTSAPPSNPPAPLNDTAPGDDPGWARVGSLNNGTGVYLGNGYVLTAQHVSTAAASVFTVDGTDYDVLSTQNIANPGGMGLTAQSDLKLVLIDVPGGSGLDGLGLLNLITSPVAVNDDVVMIGTGLTQTSQTAITFEFESQDRSGFIWSETRDKRWANADISQIGLTDTISSRDTLGVETTFDDIAGHGTAANHDSGSGLFIKIGGVWYLAGLAHSVDNLLSTDGGTTIIATHDLATTFWSDLSQYNTQINSVVIPEPGSVALLMAAGGLLALRRRAA